MLVVKEEAFADICFEPSKTQWRGGERWYPLTSNNEGVIYDPRNEPLDLANRCSGKFPAQHLEHQLQLQL